MPPKVRLDALEEQKRGADGAPQNEKTLKDVAREAVAAAHAAMPDGMPPGSIYATLSQTEIVAEASRFGFRLGAFVSEPELRLITACLAERASQGPAFKPREASAPVPQQPSAPLKVRGLKPSPSNTWRVQCSAEKPKPVSVGRGQMAMMKNGSIIHANHYTPAILQGLVDQGLKLVPIEDPEPED